MGAAKVHEFNEASKGMNLPGTAIKKAASRLARAVGPGGHSAREKSESRAQRQAMSRTKRKRLRLRKRKGDPPHFIAGAIKRPGALTAKAKAAGQSTAAYASEHAHDKGLTGKQARFANLLRSFH